MSPFKRFLNNRSKEARLRIFSPRQLGVHAFLALTVVLGLVCGSPFLPRAPHKAGAANFIPIRHIVFIIKENHSFDNYFGRFPGAHGTTTGLVKVNGAVQTINLASLIDQSPDYCHVRPCFVKDYDKGAMDHFNAAGACSTVPFTCYQAATQDQIPNYWDLASKYVLSDETYAPLAGPTFPNRLYSIAAASGRTTDGSAI